jgi:nucleotide-binding universal stress UspA family protein
MTLRNILVHLDNGPLCNDRLQLAVSLAKTHQARLVGLFGQLAQAQSVGMVATWPSPAYQEAAQKSRALFEAACADLNPLAVWRDANRGSALEVARSLIETAHRFDIVILSQDDEDAARLVPRDLPEQVVLNAGRPGLIIPYAYKAATLGQRPLIAWNGSRESVRAVNDALPLIEGSKHARLITFSKASPELSQSVEDMIAHLADHGVKATADSVHAEGIGIMDMMLNQAADLNADLLVMGASGSTGFANFRRHGGTRHILRHMTVPVLMSH